MPHWGKEGPGGSFRHPDPHNFVTTAVGARLAEQARVLRIDLVPGSCGATSQEEHRDPSGRRKAEPHALVVTRMRVHLILHYRLDSWLHHFFKCCSTAAASSARTKTAISGVKMPAMV